MHGIPHAAAQARLIGCDPTADSMLICERGRALIRQLVRRLCALPPIGREYDD